MRFDGSAAYLLGGALNTAHVTWAAWVKARSLAVRMPFVGFQDSSGSNEKELWLLTSGLFMWYAYDGSVKTTTGSTIAQTDRWYHVVGTANGSDIHLYVNGFFESSTACGNTFTSYADANLRIAGNNEGPFGNATPRYWNGDVEEVALWTEALTYGQIRALYGGQSPTTLNPESLVGYWPLKSGGGAQPDLWTNHTNVVGTNTMVRQAGTTWPSDGPTPMQTLALPGQGLEAPPVFSPEFLNIGVGLFAPDLVTQLQAPFLNIGVGLSPPVLTEDPVLPPFVPPPLPPTLGTGSGGGTVPVGPGVPLPPLSSGGLAGIRFYQGPPWRWLVTDLAGASITFLDHLAVEAEVTYTLNKPWEARLTMPADNPEVNIPHTDGDPFVSEGNRLLYGFRREGETPKWVCRFAGKVLQVEDTGETEDARTVITAWDPWQILYQRPMVNYNDEFPDQTAPKTGGPGTFFSFDDTQVGGIAGLFLRNTILNQGDVHIDMGDTTPTWSTDGTPTFNPVQLPGTSFWGGPYTAVWSGRTKSLFETTTQVDCDTQQGLMVGEVWDQMLEYGSLDLMLTPIYDPLRRPGVTSELSIYNRVGAPQYDAVFAWDKPGRNVKAFNSLRDGTKRANTIRYYSEQGGPPVGGGIPISDGASILKYEETWHEQFWVGRIQAAAFAMAELQLLLLENGIHTVEISPAPERMPFAFTEWFLGDTVPVYTSNKAREENIGFQRIYGIVLNIDENSYEQVPQVLASPDSA